ncbi:MAG: hypothetical protein M5U28_32750 [Sandaracinaceae bacterium]|nr:hypothetical protein [Sandaracinaceae bacterium]
MSSPPIPWTSARSRSRTTSTSTGRGAWPSGRCRARPWPCRRPSRTRSAPALAELEGFSTVAPVFFYFPPRSLEPASLPASPAESAREDSAVFLVDADMASSSFRRRVPVLVHYHAELGQLALRPYDGHPLVPGRRYAAVVTTSVLDDQGAPIGPDPRFAAIRDASARPADPLDAAAYDEYAPRARQPRDGRSRARAGWRPSRCSPCSGSARLCGTRARSCGRPRRPWRSSTR